MKKSILFLLFSFFALSIWAQTADDVVKKYIESIGGEAKWKAVKSMKMQGTVPTPQGDFTIEILRKAPNKFMNSLDIMGQKFIPQAFDGETGWTLNPFMGDPNPQKLPEDQLKSVKQQADFEDALIDYAKKGSEITLVGTSDVDGVKCYEIKFIKSKGTEDEVVMNYFFDSETYLPFVIKHTEAGGQMAGQEVTQYMSDYQDAGDGLMMPFSLETKVGGQTVVSVKFTKIEFNTEISDDVFKYPGQ